MPPGHARRHDAASSSRVDSFSYRRSLRPCSATRRISARGGFNWSSQRLVMEVVRWVLGERQRAVRAMRGQMWSPGRPSVARREDRVRFWQAIAAGCRARTRRARRGCRRPVGVGGSARLAGCRLSRWLRCRGAICRLPSGRRSRSFMLSELGCARSRVGWVVPRRRSRGSCAATRRRGRIGWSIGRRLRSGTRSGARAARRCRSSPRTTAARVRAGSSRRRDRETRRRAGARAGVRFIGRRHGRSPGPALGEGVEPGADREPAPGRLPR